MAEDNPKTSAAKKPAAKKAGKKPSAKKPAKKAAKKAAKKPAKKPAAKKAASKAAKKPAAKKPAAKKPAKKAAKKPAKKAAKKPAAKKAASKAAKKPAAKKPAAKKAPANKPATKKAASKNSPLHVMQYDPGRYRILVGGYECARMNALLDGGDTIEMWALSTETSGTYQPYREVSTTPTSMESLYGGKSQSEAVFLASVPFTYNYVRVPIQWNPAFDWTGAGTTPTGSPQLFEQGVYSVQQGGVEVGQLLLENTQDGCNQYWFLYEVAQGSTGVYTWPGSSNTDVTTTYAYSGPFSGPYDLERFASQLPQSTYLKGKESYIASA